MRHLRLGFSDLPNIPGLIVNQLKNATNFGYYSKMFAIWAAPLGFNGLDFEPLAFSVESDRAFGIGIP